MIAHERSDKVTNPDAMSSSITTISINFIDSNPEYDVSFLHVVSDLLN